MATTDTKRLANKLRNFTLKYFNANPYSAADASDESLHGFVSSGKLNFPGFGLYTTADGETIVRAYAYRRPRSNIDFDALKIVGCPVQLVVLGDDLLFTGDG
jgi:hypothetical protein